MNIPKLTKGKILGLALGVLLVLPAGADGKDDSVVVRCTGKVTKSAFREDAAKVRGQLSPLKKLKKSDFLAVAPGGSITLMSFADCSKMTIAVPAGEKNNFVVQVMGLATLNDRHVTRENTNEFKAVHVQSDAYQSKIGGASNRALSEDGFIAYTDRETPSLVVEVRTAKLLSAGKFQIQTIMEKGQEFKAPWAECKVNVKPAEDGTHSYLSFPGLKLQPGQTVDFCQSDTPVAADATAWLRIARYDSPTVQKYDTQLHPPKSMEEAVNYLNLLVRAQLFERAFQREAEFEKQFRAPEFWSTIKANLAEARDLNQKAKKAN